MPAQAVQSAHGVCVCVSSAVFRIATPIEKLFAAAKPLQINR